MRTIAKNVLVYGACLLIVLVTLYALSYFIPGYTPPFLQQKPNAEGVWRIGFFAHVGLGAIALAVGPFQFSKRFRTRRLHTHRLLGKVYVGNILVASSCAFYIAWFSDTGLVAGVGFACLAAGWFFTTWRAYAAIRQGALVAHEQWMYRSYSLTLAAVTLRIILPIELALLQLPFAVAYPIVAWACWVPNWLFVEWWLAQRQVSKQTQPLPG